MVGEPRLTAWREAARRVANIGSGYFRHLKGGNRFRISRITIKISPSVSLRVCLRQYRRRGKA